VKEYAKHIWRKARYSGFPRLVFDALGKLGLTIMPLYLFREGLSLAGSLGPMEQSPELASEFMSEEEMEELSGLPGRTVSKEDLVERLRRGNRCLGFRRQRDLVAFSWCDLEQCNFRGFQFPLQENEAYLFDAYTLVPYRGQRLAAAVRCALYRELAAIGKTRLLSLSYALDKPAVKFKERLNAQKLELLLFVELFRKWSLCTKVKSLSES
jgi:hypothetical protein